MSESDGKPEHTDGGFLSRWSERKLALSSDVSIDDRSPAEAFVRQQDAASADADAIALNPEPAAVLTDADMPPVADLDADSDYSGFLSQGVSESLRSQALKKLFFSGRFSAVDGLDDYAEDFTQFAALGDIVTAEMRHRIEAAAKRIAANGEGEVVEEVTAEIEQQSAEADDASVTEPDGDPPEAPMARTFKIDTDAEGQEWQ